MPDQIVSLLSSQVKHTCAEHAISFSAMETMGDRIRIQRLAKGWTQDELAERLRSLGSPVSRVAVSQWERGETKNIKNVTFHALCRELGADPEYLLFGPSRPKQRDSDGTSRKPPLGSRSGNKA